MQMRPARAGDIPAAANGPPPPRLSMWEQACCAFGSPCAQVLTGPDCGRVRGFSPKLYGQLSWSPYSDRGSIVK